MVTLTGTQRNFMDSIKDLVELEYDAHEAYEAAINRLETPAYKDKLIEFKKDHEQHIASLSKFLRDHNQTPPEGPSSKQWLTKGKVVLNSLLGEQNILAAMLSNELDTNTAYERIQNREDVMPEASSALSKAFEDEKRHKKWLETAVAK